MSATHLRQIFSKVNVYSASRYGGNAPVFKKEQLEARKNIFGDTWDVYLHEQRREWVSYATGGFFRSGVVARHILIPQKEKKLAASVSFNEAVSMLRTHDENPNTLQLINSSGRTSKNMGTHLEQVEPRAGQIHWRQAPRAQP
jgi:hypothetical protein